MMADTWKKKEKICYGSWHAGSVSQVMEVSGSVLVEVLWDGEATISLRETESRKKRGYITEEEAASQFIHNPPSSTSKIEEPAPKATAVAATSWQFKGEGKGGSLGTLVSAISTSTVKAEQPAIPPPLKANTEKDVEEMFHRGNFKYPEAPFWNGRNYNNVVKCTPLLVEK